MMKVSGSGKTTCQRSSMDNSAPKVDVYVRGYLNSARELANGLVPFAWRIEASVQGSSSASFSLQ